LLALDYAEPQIAIVRDVLETGRKYNVRQFQTYLTSNYFGENFTGIKGSAVYIKNMSKIRIYSSTFYHNGPTLSIREAAFSTYYKALSRTEVVMFTDVGQVCVDEFQYLEDCKQEYSYIDYARPEGALHVEFCN